MTYMKYITYMTCITYINVILLQFNPIYKKKEKSLFINYRPISILPQVSKIMEKNNSLV